VDGEPFMIPPSKILVEHHNQAPVLINSSKDKFGRQLVRLTTAEPKVSTFEVEQCCDDLLKRLQECQQLAPEGIKDELNTIETYLQKIRDPLSLLELIDTRITTLTSPKIEMTKPKKNKKILLRVIIIQDFSPKVMPSPAPVILRKISDK